MNLTEVPVQNRARAGRDEVRLIAIGEALDVLARAPDEVLAEDLPQLVGAIEAAKARAWRRMGAPKGTPTPEVLVTVDEALALVPGVGRRTLLRLTQGLRFRRDLSRKTVRFVRAGLLAWEDARKA
jgi:hypothetical protein